MLRFSVLVVEPLRQHRERFQNHLTLRFDVLTAPDIASAQQIFETKRPDAVISSLRLDNSHGLQFCKSLRDRPGSEATLFLVHGNPGAMKAVDREAVQKKWRIDIFLPQPSEPDVIEPLLWHELTRRDRVKRAAEAEAQPTVAQATPTGRKEESGSGWSKLFKKEITFQSIKSALNKDL